MGMKILPKILPFTILLFCSALLVSCTPKPTENADAVKQDQDRLAEEHQARQERLLHEREAALDERERLLAQREQQTASAAPATAGEAPQPAAPAAVATPTPAVSTSASYQAFYDNLAPYGSWIEMPGYGYVWQPQATVQDPSWRPYTLGRWAFTDQGWSWVSNEPFGWITYHYGRWMRTHSLNWVWFPGDQWAPAWVSWRYGGDYAGWAPLPPEARFNPTDGIKQWADDAYNLSAADYTFVPATEFGDDSMAAAAIPPDQNGAVFDDSNNITNIYYDAGAYAIFCYGPSFDFMRSKAHRPLLPYLSIRRLAFRADGRNGSAISGNTLQVTAPLIVQPRTPVAPRVVHARVAEARLINPPPQPPSAALSSQGAEGAAAGGTRPTLDSPPPGNNPRENAPDGMRIPARMNPAGSSPQFEEQTARDIQIIQQQQIAGEERARVESLRATQGEQAAQQRAAAAARLGAAQEAAARGAQGSGAQVVHSAQPSGAAAGTQQQPAGQGRGQQQ